MFTQFFFRTNNFFTESVRLSFVDLRWAQLYVSLVSYPSGELKLDALGCNFVKTFNSIENWKLKLGWKGPWTSQMNNPIPSFDFLFLLTESRLLVRVNSFQMKNRIAVWSRCIYRESFSRLMKRNIYYPVCNIPCSYEWITKPENVYLQCLHFEFPVKMYTCNVCTLNSPCFILHTSE